MLFITLIISLIACSTTSIRSENIKISSFPAVYARTNAAEQSQLLGNVIALVDEVEIEWLPEVDVHMLSEEAEYEYIPAR